MMKKLLFSLFGLLLCVQVSVARPRRSARPDTLKYRITFTDKRLTPFSLDEPERFLSAKSLARRARQQLPVDSTDLPVCSDYIRQVLSLGVCPVVAGKWENFLTVSCRDTAWMEAARRLPFVKEIRPVWRASSVWGAPTALRDTLSNRLPSPSDTLYGAADDQIRMMRGDSLHRAGFRGEGMTIAIIDAGFHNADRMQALRTAHIAGVRDFVTPGSDLFAESSHGLGVLSCMAPDLPGVLVGSAPAATYWLLRSEDEYSETPVEQDYWAAAVEFADSVGVDLINSSLGYYSFSSPEWDYAYRHLDGRFSLIARQASRVASKGMLLVCSAGNSGEGSWKKITPPADAFDVLTVGAVDRLGVLAPFSSVGPTADGRIKPDIVAMGKGTAVLYPDGSVGEADGTSFAAPVACGLAACLWQALPRLTVRQLLALIRSCGDRLSWPDNIYGYGLPDFWAAYLSSASV